jgi:hypothetical protein
MTTEKLVQMNFTPEQQMIAHQKREEAAEQRERDRKRVSQLLRKSRESAEKDWFGTSRLARDADKAAAAPKPISPDGVFPILLMEPSIANSTQNRQKSAPSEKMENTCMTCSHMHISCDGGRPGCQNCAKSSLACFYKAIPTFE